MELQSLPPAVTAMRGLQHLDVSMNLPSLTLPAGPYLHAVQSLAADWGTLRNSPQGALASLQSCEAGMSGLKHMGAGVGAVVDTAWDACQGACYTWLFMPCLPPTIARPCLPFPAQWKSCASCSCHKLVPAWPPCCVRLLRCHACKVRLSSGVWQQQLCLRSEAVISTQSGTLPS